MTTNKDISPTDGLISREEICKIYKVTPVTVGNWEKQGLDYAYMDTAKKKARWYDPDHVTQWYNNHFGKTESVNDAELRKKIADATLAEIKVLKARGELVNIDDVVSIIAQELSNVRAKLIALPGIIAPHIYVDDMAVRLKMVEDAVNNILEEISADTMTQTQWKGIINTDVE